MMGDTFDVVKLSTETENITRELSRTSVEWNIPNFKNPLCLKRCLKNRLGCLKSPRFQCSGAFWKLKLYPYGTRNSKDSVCISVEKLGCEHWPTNHIVSAKFTVPRNRREDRTCEFEKILMEGVFVESKCLEIMKIERLLKNNSGYLINGILTIKCDMSVYELMREQCKVPGGPPLDVEVRPTGSQSLKVTWKPPREDLQHGTIRGYYIGYRAATDLDGQYQYKNVESSGNSPELSYLTNLRRLTSYKVIVQAYNDVGAGPRSDEVTTTTLEAVEIIIMQEENDDSENMQCNEVDTSHLCNYVIKDDVDTLSTDMEALYMNPSSADVTLKVGRHEFKAHKVVLRSRSKVFNAMFEHDMKENQQGTVNISNVEPDTFKDLLRYIYCGKVRQLSFLEALHLYAAADQYDMQGLVLNCRKVLLNELSTDNISEIATAADLHSDQFLVDAVKSFLNTNMKAVLMTEKWETFSRDNPILSMSLIRSAIVNN